MLRLICSVLYQLESVAVTAKKHVKQSALGSKLVCSILKPHHLKSTIDVSLPLLESMGINASRLSRKDICEMWLD